MSVDSTWANKAFREQLGIDFPILSDARREVSRKYGVCQMREKDGARKLCVISSTFIIDSHGVVRHALYDINPRGHVSQVLQLVKQLEKPCKLRKIPS